MGIFAGMDVSDKTTHLCVVDGEGVVIRRDVVVGDPDVLARWLRRHCGGLVRARRRAPLIGKDRGRGGIWPESRPSGGAMV